MVNEPPELSHLRRVSLTPKSWLRRGSIVIPLKQPDMTTICLALIHASGFLGTPSESLLQNVSKATCLARLCLVAETPRSCLTALEFYSGIGGFRVSLEAAVEAANFRAGLETRVSSFDINAVANSVYEHNFPQCSVTRRSIEHLSENDVDGGADLWLLRIGKQMDEGDNRSSSLIHLLSLLGRIERPPAYFFLENVKGFENSSAHRRMLEKLSARGFAVEQYLLSPVQLGIPNTRLRYYCLASRHGQDDEGTISPVQEALPPDYFLENPQQGQVIPLCPLSEYLDLSLAGEAVVPLILSEKECSYANPNLRFDIVTLESSETITFTKGYGKHAGRAGPVILLTDDGERRVSSEKLERFPTGMHLGPRGRELRWFSDREMLRVHGYPETFKFPQELSLRQRFSLIGNSVNVQVIALLLKRLLFSSRSRPNFKDALKELHASL